MGGTKILSAVINSTEGTIAVVKESTETGATQKQYIKQLASIIKKTIKEAKVTEDSIKAVCIGFPGPLDPFTGIIYSAPNLGLKNFPIKKLLQEVIPYPVLIENDVNLGALGIQKFGVAKKGKNVLTVFIGTGIGGALTFNGKIYRGSNFVAGEIGHIIVNPKGSLCNCGNRGCFETIASRSAIVKHLEAEIKANKRTMLKKIFKQGKPIKSKALYLAVKAVDKLTIKEITGACNTIGLVLANINNLLDLDLIVLGGGLMEALDYYMIPKIKTAFNKNIMKGSGKGIKIVASKLADDAALYGGIALAEEFLNIKV